MRLGGKVALITGAGSGIGRRTALLFASEGASVAAVDIDPVSVSETVAEIEEAGGQGLAVVADVSRDADCRAMVEAAERLSGGSISFQQRRGQPRSGLGCGADHRRDMGLHVFG